MDDFNEGFGQSTHRKRAAQMGLALPGSVLDVDVRDDSGESDGDGTINLGWLAEGDLLKQQPTLRYIPDETGYTPPAEDRSPQVGEPDLTPPNERGSFDSREGVGGRAPVAPSPESRDAASPLPDKPGVIPTSAAFSEGIACFVYTVAQVPEVYGTPGMPASLDPTCAALVLHSADDDWDGDLGDVMMSTMLQLATQQADPSTVWSTDFDALRHLANVGAVVVGPQFCDAEQVLLGFLDPGTPYEDYDDIDYDTGADAKGDRGDKGLMTGLIVAGALAAYYFLAEK